MNKRTSVSPKATTPRELARVSLILPTKLRKALDREADKQGRSLNSQCIRLLQRGLEVERAAA
jgi:hypothetical protein